jgi:hypothetical protein
MDNDPTLESTDKIIEAYCKAILKYLDTNVLEIRPKQYMEAYNCVVMLSDEMSLSEDLYQMYKDKISVML